MCNWQKLQIKQFGGWSSDVIGYVCGPFLRYFFLEDHFFVPTLAFQDAWVYR